MRRATFLVGLLACLAGCAPPGEPVADPNSDAQGKRFEPPSQGMAALYVVRGNDLPGTPPIAVSVGSRQLGTLASNTWLRIEVAPGTYDVRATGSDGAGSHYVSVWPQEIRFLDVTYAGRSQRGVVSELSPEQGRQVVLSGRRVR